MQRVSQYIQRLYKYIKRNHLAIIALLVAILSWLYPKGDSLFNQEESKDELIVVYNDTLNYIKTIRQAITNNKPNEYELRDIFYYLSKGCHISANQVMVNCIKLAHDVALDINNTSKKLEF